MSDQIESEKIGPARGILVLAPVFWPKYPPIGVYSLQAYSNKLGELTEVFDMNHFFYRFMNDDAKREWQKSCNRIFEEGIVEYLESSNSSAWNEAMDKLTAFEVVGFSVFQSNLKATLQIASMLKELSPKMRVVLGGPEITRQYFKLGGGFKSSFPAADLLVVGEGEKPWAAYLRGQIDSRSIFFDELGDLEELPCPLYEEVDFGDYPAAQAAALLFSRGCQKACAFCSERLLYRHFRKRSVESMCRQIAYLKSRGIERFIFHDSMLNADPQALESLCDGMISHFGKVAWEAQFGVNAAMSADLLAKVKESGCYNLFIGLESGCGRTLKQMNKGYSPQEATLFFKKLSGAGLHFGVSMIVGYPGETEGDFEESLNYILEHKDLIPKIEQVNPFVRYDGTGLSDSVRPLGVVRMERFVRALKAAGMRYTNAFVGNLIEPGA